MTGTFDFATADASGALARTEDEVASELLALHQEFDSRHLEIEGPWLQHFELLKPHIFTHRPLSAARMLLLGALFSGEYALESAALFNPSIVPHHDQSGVAEGAIDHDNIQTLAVQIPEIFKKFSGSNFWFFSGSQQKGFFHIQFLQSKNSCSFLA